MYTFLTCPDLVHFYYILSFRFEALLAMGKKLIPSSPMSPEVRERMKLLSQERDAVSEAWENRNKLLNQCTDIQVMNIIL